MKLFQAPLRVDVGIGVADKWFRNSLPKATPVASVNPMQIMIFIGSILWALGVVGLLIYSLVSYIHLQRKISTAILISDNIFECEHIKSPFVLGIVNPKIYLLIGLMQKEQDYIIIHEQIHIRRLDYLVKPFAFLVVCFHWFNPLVWLAFRFMGKDQEMSCDEGVLKRVGKDIKKDYSHSILAFAREGNTITGSPLAFGESNIDSRN